MQNYFFKEQGKIYIISGQFKGRKILVRKDSNIHPTTNQIRETLFSWLSTYIKNASCLDCFAGSGALGIEAISRYASFSTLLEINKNTILTLKKNVKKLNIYNIEIIHTNTFSWLKKKGKPYDIIFLDPPYYKDFLNRTIILLENNKWIKNNSLIYIEKEKQKTLIIPKYWILYKKKITRKIECYLYIFNASKKIINT